MEIAASGWTISDELAQRAEQALEGLMFQLAEIANGDSDEETPSGIPYDGCITCDVREYLTVLVPMIAEAVVAGEVHQ